MKVPESWRQLVEETRLGDRRVRTRLDRWICRKQRQQGLQGVPPLTVERAYNDIKDLPVLQQQYWFACTTTIALTGELLLGTNDGLILAKAKDRWNRHTEPQAWLDVQAINLLRNAVCHPASQPIPELCHHIENREREKRELAVRLQQDWSLLGKRPVAEYALEKLDLVIGHVMARYNPN